MKFLSLLGLAFKYLFTVVPGSIKGHLNVIELLSVLVAAPLSGGSVAGVIAYVLAHAAIFLPAAGDQWLVSLLVALAGAIGSGVVAAKTKLSQGKQPLGVVGERAVVGDRRPI